MRSSFAALVLITCWTAVASGDDPPPAKPNEAKKDAEKKDAKGAEKKDAEGAEKKGVEKKGAEKKDAEKKPAPKAGKRIFPFPPGLRPMPAPNAGKTEADLMKELDSKVAKVRADAANALGQRNVDDALPKLQKLWHDPDLSVRLAAIQAMAGIAKSDALLGKVVALFGDKVEKVRFAAGYVLQQKGAKKALPHLAQALANKDRNVRFMTLQVLKRFGADAKAAAPGLQVLLTDADAEVRLEAARTLGTMRCKEAAVSLIAGLTHKTDGKLRAVSAMELRFFKDLGAPAVPALRKLLADKEWKAAYGAARALRGIGPAAKAAVPDLIKTMDHKIYNLRNAAIMALGGIGKAAVPELIKALPSERRKVKKGAAEALGWIGPDAEAGVGPLTQLLKDDHHQVRRSAVEALGRIGAKASSAVEALRSLEEDDDDRRVRRAARVALKRILTAR